MTDRAVSITVNYVLSLVITTLLMSGLLVGVSGVLENRQESAIRSELRVVGERVAATLMAADRLAATEGAEAVTLDASIPRTVAGSRYTITVNATPSDATLVLESTDPYERVEVSFTNETKLPGAEVSGGDIRVELVGDALEVRQA